MMYTTLYTLYYILGRTNILISYFHKAHNLNKTFKH